MFFKFLIVIMSLLIFDSHSYYVPKDRLPRPWALYRYNVIKALGPKRDVESINDYNNTERCQDAPDACPDQGDNEAPTGPGIARKPKKLNMVNSMDQDIWRIMAEQSKVVPVILVSDDQNVPRN